MDERQMILRMLKEGKITLEEADALLQALADTGPEPAVEAGPSAEATARTEAPHEGPGPAQPPRSEWAEVKSEWAGVRDEVQSAIAEILKVVPREVIRGIRGGTRPWHRGMFVDLVQGLHGLPMWEGTISADEAMGEGDRLVIRNRWGDVTLRAASGGRMRMEGRTRVWAPTKEDAEHTSGVIGFTAQRTGSTVTIDVPRPEHARVRADMEIDVPRGVKVSIDTAKGDLRAAGLAGALRVEIASGDVMVSDHEGSVTVDVKRGDLTVRRITGDLEVAIRSGDIRAAAVQGRVSGRVLSGDVEVEEAGSVRLDVINGDVAARRPARDVHVETKSGDVAVEGAGGQAVRVRVISGDVAVRGDVRELLQVDTVSGDILVELPAQAQATIDAGTRSGEVECSLPLRNREGTRRSLRGVLNEPGAMIRLQAVSGDIDIRGTTG